MKLSYVLLLAVVAVVAADSEYYQNSYPQEEHYQNSYPEEEPQSNYYSSRRGRPAKRGGLVGMVKRFFGIGATRRQFTGPTGTGTGTGFTGAGNGFTGAGNGGQFVGQQAGFVAPAATGGGFPLLPAVLLGGLGLAAIAGLIGAAFLFTQLNNSGRGLDTDEWEVDHSVWMDQLQRDFEDSWSTEN